MIEMDAVRREAVLAAAMATFERYGYRRTSMETLAEAAGMSRPALYQYFRNKEAIFREMTQWALEVNSTAATTAAGKARTPAAAIEAILDAVLDLHAGDDSQYSFEFLDDVLLRAADLWQQYEGRILEALQEQLRAAFKSRKRSAAPTADVADTAAALFYGTKGISLSPLTSAHRRKYVAVLTAAVVN